MCLFQCRSSRDGKSVRKWLPRLSVRLSAALAISQPTVTMGIYGDGRTFQVPNSAHEVAWYNFSGAPGSSSQNAIFAGHINYYGATGTFRYIGNLAAGDIVEVHTIDGLVDALRDAASRRLLRVRSRDPGTVAHPEQP